MKLIFAPIWRKRLWRKRDTCRLFYFDKTIYGNSALLREVSKVMPGVYRVISVAWYVESPIPNQFFERKGW